MKIEHVAIWAQDLEQLKGFYLKYFEGKSNEKYTNEKKGYSSYFISFDDGSRLEIMKMDSIPNSKNDPIVQATGLIHFAFSVGSEEKVNELTGLLKNDGYQVLDGPRHTGDGYYESVVLDPEGNRLEITK
jgi:lactoylglutathione lyase